MDVFGWEGEERGEWGRALVGGGIVQHSSSISVPAVGGVMVSSCVIRAAAACLALSSASILARSVVAS